MKDINKIIDSLSPGEQNVTCHHEYVYKEYGNIHFEECRKCGRIKNYIG